MIEFILNDQHIATQLPPTMVLLDFIRKEKKITGTKEGCREGDCGACTVLAGSLYGKSVKYKSVNSCLVPLAAVHGKHIVTIEGLSGRNLSPIQEAMINEGGTQCGFCTPGFIVSLTGYFMNCRKTNIDDAFKSLAGNICRCTGYEGIKRAAANSISVFEKGRKRKTLDRLIELNFLPEYFKTVPENLKTIRPFKSNERKKEYFISGGTDLYVQKWESIVNSTADFVHELKLPDKILETKNQIKIGGAATVQSFLESPVVRKYFPSLAGQLELFGSLPIRNSATIAGNIVNASPIGDLTNVLLALDADLHLRDGKRKRTIFLRDFYKGYKSLNKRKPELIEWVTITIPPRNFYFNYEKVSKRTYLDIASVNSTIAFIRSKNKITCLGISAGGVAPTPLYLGRTCEFLCGKEINSENIRAAAAVANKEISPISDARGSAEYKRLLLRQLFYSHFLKLFPQMINAEDLL